MDLQVFKNGYALVTKSVTLPASAGAYVSNHFSVGPPPSHACHGTVWVMKPEDTTVVGLRTETKAETKSTGCTTIPSILKANIGATVEVRIGDDWVEGKVEDVMEGAEDTGLLALATNIDSKPRLRTFPLSNVKEVAGASEQLRLRVDEQCAATQDLVLEYTGAGGKASITHLRQGFNWAPSYLWDLGGDQKATISASATIMNDTEEGGKVDRLQCVVGNPNMKFGTVRDALVSNGTINDFLTEMQYGGVDAAGGARGYRSAGGMQSYQAVTQNVVQVQSASFGGGSGDDGFVDVAGEGEDLSGVTDDVHFLSFENIELKAKQRIALPIFSVTTGFADVYRASVNTANSYSHYSQAENQNQLDVWHALKLANKTTKPWTTAPVMITKDGSFIAQSLVNYTPVGADTLVNVAKALNVRAKYEQTTVQGAGQEAVMGRACSVQFVDTVVSIQNGKPLDIELIVDFTATGELVSASAEPKKNSERGGLRYGVDFNRPRDLQWAVKVPASGAAEISFQLKLLYPV